MCVWMCVSMVIGVTIPVLCPAWIYHDPDQDITVFEDEWLTEWMITVLTPLPYRIHLS